MNEDIENDILLKFSLPHIFFSQDTVQHKKIFAWHVASLSGEEVLLTTSFGFSYSGFIAGLTVAQIEYIAKNAPYIYKKELMDAIGRDYVIKEVMEIVKLMDEDVREGNTTNQIRFKNVIRYIKDNIEVFKF